MFNAKEGLGGVVRALQNKGLFQSLAEPNLIASNGKEASFLAGGDPYPVVQGGTGGSGNAVTIMFKEFGVRLTFTPTVIGNDLVHLKVKPEVSALDFANGVVVSGFRVPALSTRRTETEVELQNGQTFAIAGLMNNTLTNSMSKIPGIGDIPDPRPAVPQQGAPEEPDRARRHDHADDHQEGLDGRVRGSAEPGRAVPGRASQDVSEPDAVGGFAALPGQPAGAAHWRDERRAATAGVRTGSEADAPGGSAVAGLDDERDDDSCRARAADGQGRFRHPRSRRPRRRRPRSRRPRRSRRHRPPRRHRRRRPLSPR